MPDPNVLSPLDKLQKAREEKLGNVTNQAKNVRQNIGEFTREIAEVMNAAQIALLAFGQRPQIGPILLNSTLVEVHAIDAEMTQRPVDGDGSVGDHYIRAPRIFVMEAVISEYPDNVVHQFGHFGPGSKYKYADRKATAWADIKALWESETPFEVITDLEVYPRMLFLNCETVKQDNSDLLLRATLQEYRIVGLSIEDQLAIDQLDYSSQGADVGNNQATEVIELPGLDAFA